MGWKSIVAKVAPTIGSALGTPLVGMAISTLCSVFGITGEDDVEKKVANAIEKASAAELLALKKADLDFAVQMKKLGLEEEKLFQIDRNKAREREKEMNSLTTPILAISVTAGFFILVVYMMMRPIPYASKDVLYVLLGALGSGWMAKIGRAHV